MNGFLTRLDLTEVAKVTKKAKRSKDEGGLGETVVEPQRATGQCLLYVLGEAPGEEDENRGVPFVGESGHLLRSVIRHLDIDAEVTFDNTCRRRPFRNRDPKEDEQQLFRKQVTDDILAARPYAVLAVGRFAALWFMPDIGGIAGLRGRSIRYGLSGHNFRLFPVAHPSFVLRKSYEQEPTFRRDVARACAFANARLETKISTKEELERQVTIATSSKQVSKLFARMKGVTLFGDLETTTKRPYDGGVIRTIAVSDGRICVSCEFEHALPHLPALVRRFKRFVFHNAIFDVEWLLSVFGFEVFTWIKFGCTQTQAYVLDERPEYQSLDYLTQQEIGIPIKTLSDIDKSKIATEPLEKLLRYNGLDTVVLQEVHNSQMRKLRAQGLEHVYAKQCNLLEALPIAQWLGLPVSQRTAVRMQEKLQPQLRQLEKRIFAHPYVKGSPNFNPGSPPQVMSVLRKNGHKVANSNKATLEEIGNEFCETVLDYRAATKLVGTYIKEFAPGGKHVYPNGYIHTNFKHTFVVTSRLSSSDPALQNFPARNPVAKKARRVVQAPKGWVILKADYGQLEARFVAWESRDVKLCTALWERYDIHKEWAEMLAQTVPSLQRIEDPKKRRDLTKNKFVFPKIYGAIDASLAKYFDCSESEISPHCREFESQFAGITAWQQEILRFYERNLYVETLFGRRRRAPLSSNQIINSPVQGGAAELVLHAMTNCASLVRREGLPKFLYPRLNIHDDLTWMIPERALDEFFPVILGVLLDLRFDWICTPIQVEVSVGPNWCDVEEIGKFESDIVLGWPSRVPEFERRSA